mgnify:CR=1 FL=1
MRNTFKTILVFLLLAVVFTFILYEFAEFKLGAAMFIGVGTIVLSYLIPTIANFKK